MKQTCSFKWVPLQSLRFALNYTFTDSYSGKIFERHFFKYLYLKVTRRFSHDSGGSGTLGEAKTTENGLVATIENNTLRVNDREIRSLLKDAQV